MEFDFEKNATVESLDAVPEQYKGIYVEGTNDEGATVFTIADTAKGIVEAYIGTNKSLSQSRADKKTASDEAASRRAGLKSFEETLERLGLDDEKRNPEGLNEYIEELRKQVKGGEAMKINLDKVNADWEKRLAELSTSKDEEISAKTRALANHLIGDVATREITAAKGSAMLLMPVIKGMVKVVQDGDSYVVRVLDAQGDFRSDGKGGFMGVSDLVAELKLNSEFARAFESEVSSGSGTTPGSTSSKTPVGKTEMTAQEKIAFGLKKKQHQAA